MKHFLLSILVCFAVLSFLFPITSPIFAQTATPRPRPTIAPIRLTLPAQSQFRSVSAWSPTALARALIVSILIIASLVAFINLIIGGFQWISSGGNKEGIVHAQRRITHALIGLIITFGAYGIFRTFGYLTGINVFCLDIPGVGVTRNLCPPLSGNPAVPTPTP